MKQIHALAGIQLQPFMREKFHASTKIATPCLTIILTSLPKFHIYVGGERIHILVSDMNNKIKTSQ